MFIRRVKKINWKELLSFILLAVFAVPAFLGDGMHLLLPHHGACCLHICENSSVVIPDCSSFCSDQFSESPCSGQFFENSTGKSFVKNESSHHEEVHSIDFCPVCSFCSFGKINISGSCFFTNFVPSNSFISFDQIFFGQKKHLCHQGRSPPLSLFEIA